MINNNMAIIALSLAFGVILLCRVGFRVYKRIDMVQRYQRIPSSGNYPALTFDMMLGFFLVAISLAMSY